MGSRRTLDLARAVPINKYNYIHPWLRMRTRWHHRFKKEDFRTLDKRNQENASMLLRLIDLNRIETTIYAAKWITILGNRVLDLAFLGPEIPEAKAELEDIFFLRYHPSRRYQIEKLYNELVPQLEYIDGELIRTVPLRINEKCRTICVTEFANNGLPALPFPEEMFQRTRYPSYPEIMMHQNDKLSHQLDVGKKAVSDTATEMLSLLPEAKNIQAKRVHNTQMDLEGGTLVWQAERVAREIELFQERYRKQEERNALVENRGEKVNLYHKIQQQGYRIPGKQRNTPLTKEDYNNGYRRLTK